jgi:hypothetical protein
MNSVTMYSAFLETFALLAYGVGSITIQRFNTVGRIVLVFVTIGVLLDGAATVLMIVGSSNKPFAIQFLLRYSASLVMFIVAIWAWNTVRKNGKNKTINEYLIPYVKIAYGWWVITYFTSSILVIF